MNELTRAAKVVETPDEMEIGGSTAASTLPNLGTSTGCLCLYLLLFGLL